MNAARATLAVILGCLNKFRCRHSASLTNFPKNSRNFFFLGGLYILYPQYHSILVEEGEYREIFLVSALKKRHILTKFELCKKFRHLAKISMTRVTIRRPEGGA